ncbi:MAG: protein translocase subunit SecF [Candidatus Peribacteraceae bacterium]|nr:protein translocase subunit SecF [Candidatus Peribacteraceae bacterium]
MSFLKPAKALLTISTLLTIVSAVLLFVPGPKLSLEFTGGTLMEVVIPQGKTKEDILQALRSFQPTAESEGLGNATVSVTKQGTALIRARDISNEEHLSLVQHMEKTLGGTIDERQYTTIGPTVGSTLKRRALWALVVASITIILYIAVAFKNVPRKLNPWKFGLFAVIAMVHDTLITTGIFTILSRTTTFEMDTLFITALLTLFGFSVNDTIVIFDRIRENVGYQERGEDFASVADRSLSETFKRTVITTTGALIMLFALLFLGPDSIFWFILALIIGTGLGTYSSYFIATPLLVYWRKKPQYS